MRKYLLITFAALLLLLAGMFGLFDKKYHNIGEVGDSNFIKFVKWQFTREKPQWPELPVDRPSFSNPNIPNKVYEDDLSVTYINHATTLIQIGGKNILTDPIWSDYAGPFGKFGVKRSIYPGIDIKNLPKIDFILISHSHYDHLDLPTIEELVKRNNPVILTGLGVSKYIDYCKAGADRCHEMDWWKALKVKDVDINISFVPAYHWSSRYFVDKDTTLWGGFVISKGDDNIYFSGDTGFADGEIFRMIKKKFGHFRLALLPIGAYKPSWFFSSMHISPLEAVKIFKILESDYAIPIHYDTFELTDDKYDDPLNDLKAALKEQNVSENQFNIVPAGGIIQIPKAQE